MLRLSVILPLLATTLSVAKVDSAQAFATPEDCEMPIDPIVGISIDGNVTGIQNLQFCVREGGSRFLDTYNVDFSLASFNDTFGDPTQPGFTPSCDIGLCFWGEGGRNTSNTVLAIQAINKAINDLNPTPMNIEDEDFVIPPPPFPPLPNTRDFYFIPHSANGTTITSDQGDNPWTVVNFGLNIENESTPNITMYTGFELTAREEVFEIPESSNLVGVIVAGVSILLFTQSNKF